MRTTTDGHQSCSKTTSPNESKVLEMINKIWALAICGDLGDLFLEFFEFVSILQLVAEVTLGGNIRPFAKDKDK